MKNLVGRKFGRWTVVGFPSKGRMACVCECGTKRSPLVHDVTRGASRSCGCLQREMTGDSCRSHGMSRTIAYLAWASMLSRCYNKNVANYKNYGGRGITVCRRWHKFENFYADMGERPNGMTLHRINNDGNYTKKNCEWATRSTQNRNRRGLRMIAINGVNKCLKEWSEIYGIHYRAAMARIRIGWPPVLALTVPRIQGSCARLKNYAA